MDSTVPVFFGTSIDYFKDYKPVNYSKVNLRGQPGAVDMFTILKAQSSAMLIIIGK